MCMYEGTLYITYSTLSKTKMHFFFHSLHEERLLLHIPEFICSFFFHSLIYPFSHSSTCLSLVHSIFSLSPPIGSGLADITLNPVLMVMLVG